MKSQFTFGPAEAEAAVRELRAHLRHAEAAAQEGNAEAAHNSAVAADHIIETLLKSLAGRFERYKWNNFAGQPLETQEDGVREMVLQVCRGLRNLSDRAGAKYFETNFNAAVESCIYDAIRVIWREQERDLEKRAPVSLNQQITNAAGENEAEPLMDQIEDESALRDVNNALGTQIVKQLLQQLPSHRHAAVLMHRMCGRNWDEVAEQVGVSEKTARNYFKTSESLLKQLLVDM